MLYRLIHNGNFKSSGTLVTVDRINYHTDTHKKDLHKEKQAVANQKMEECLNHGAVAMTCGCLSYSVFSVPSVRKFVDKVSEYRHRYGYHNYEILMDKLEARKVMTHRVENLTTKLKSVNKEFN